MEPSQSGIFIRQLVDSDSVEELTDLLHRAYAVLAEMGLRYLATHQDVETTKDRIKNGTCFVAEMENRIVGTLTYYPPGRSHGSPFMSRQDVAHIGQMAVEPSLQSRGIATMLMKRAEEQAQTDGAMELALDTAEPAQHLISWYERRGYRLIEHVRWEITNYRSVVMSKRLGAL